MNKLYWVVRVTKPHELCFGGALDYGEEVVVIMNDGGNIVSARGKVVEREPIKKTEQEEEAVRSAVQDLLDGIEDTIQDVFGIDNEDMPEWDFSPDGSTCIYQIELESGSHISMVGPIFDDLAARRGIEHLEGELFEKFFATDEGMALYERITGESSERSCPVFTFVPMEE